MRLSPRVLTLSVGLTIATVLGCLVAFLPVPYVTMKPGPVFDTLGEVDGTAMITFGDGVRTYPTEGRLDFTTVSITRAESHLSLAAALEGWLDPDVAVVPHDFMYPDHQTDEESSAQSAAQLASSQDSARAAALRAAGYEVREVPRVVEVVEGGPADGVLRVEDVIVRIDGARVSSPDEVGAAIREHRPGESVELIVEREGRRIELTVGTEPTEDDPDRPRVGILVGTGFEFPIEVENHIGDRVGGSSAGMMFALAIYDALTPGSLTGGRNVAGTGTIDPDGDVGPIGGVRQKMAGAARNGSDVFLVPSENCDEAVEGDDFGMTLVKVDTVEDAIDALETLAENPKAEVTSCG